MDDKNEQHTIAAEFYIWSDTPEQAREKLRWALARLEFDSEVEEG